MKKNRERAALTAGSLDCEPILIWQLLLHRIFHSCFDAQRNLGQDLQDEQILSLPPAQQKLAELAKHLIE